MYFPCWLAWNITLGVATSAYQTEGAWNVSGKLDSVWDEFTHRIHSPISDKSNGDIACDSYNRYLEDITLAKSIGAKLFRFSISWPRVLYQNGSVNHEGVNHYRAVIQSVTEHEMIPFVTLFHWDTPNWIEKELGGWADPEGRVIPLFVNYSNTMFRELGDLVENWITFNEPYTVATQGYGDGSHAPGKKSVDAPYMVFQNMILAHQETYKQFHDSQRNGKIGIAINMEWIEADRPSDKEAAERARLWRAGIVLDPLLKGSYPALIKPHMPSPFLRTHTPTLDFLGLNHYTTLIARTSHRPIPVPGTSNFWEDQMVELRIHHHWHQSEAPWLFTVPYGLGATVEWLRERYFPFKLDLYITENGYASPPIKNDYNRITYLGGYMCSLMNTQFRFPSLNIKGYFVWSLLDNFEWAAGYTQRFGIVQVDFDNNQERTIKESAHWIQSILNA